MSNNATFLEVEDDEQRQNRIRTLLERLNTTASPSSSAPNIGRGRQSSPGPCDPSELLARVEAFLPAISASNEALSQKKPEDINIENVAEDDEQYIEMNLGLGVFEAKPRPEPRSDADSASDSSMDTSDTDSSSSCSEEEEDENADEDSDSDFDSDEDTDDSDAASESGSSVDMKPVSSRPIKPLPRRVSQQTKLEV